MKALPYKDGAFDLMMEGAVALAEVEKNGMAIDTEYLDKAQQRTERRIKRASQRLMDSVVWKAWRKTYRGRANLNSSEQLGVILFDTMGLPSPGRTPSGKHKTDEESLAKIDHPFPRDLIQIKKLQKALATYLRGISREIVDGRLHPFFNLHTTKTFRSSSDSPNFQNIPVRDPVIRKLVRRAFIADPGQHLVEVDYSGIEVRVATCYHKDPAMIKYIKDPLTDLHRDMAMECYSLDQSEVTKEIRYCGKNMFIFPQFYGDYWVDCARNLWEAISKMRLKTVSGTPLRKHLKVKGIKRLGELDPRTQPKKGTFAYHIKEVERTFWDEKFPVYKQWRLDWFKEYQEQGWFETLTGFICQGYMKRNETINYPVQGSAFHCLLWSLIRIIRELRRRRMRTKIVGQIHDSIVATSPSDELDDYIGLAREIMVDDLREAWSWLIVPLDIEAEVVPIGGSWYDKKAFVG